jgi:cobalt-precorrin 5A hydrolase
MAPGYAGHAMEIRQAMIVAGFGCRKGVGAAEVVAAYRAALDRHGIDGAAFLAAPFVKSEEQGLQDAARQLRLTLLPVESEDLARCADRVLTRSERVAVALGVPSASEAAALHVAGARSSLLGPRVALGRVTCALAYSKDEA